MKGKLSSKPYWMLMHLKIQVASIILAYGKIWQQNEPLFAFQVTIAEGKDSKSWKK